jgi:hypothetical protein
MPLELQGLTPMPLQPAPTDLISLLRSALDVADALGMSRIACHIDHALALTLEATAADQPAAPSISSRM